MFEVQYNDEMAAEIQRLEAENRAVAVGHPEWINACAGCGCQLMSITEVTCDRCR